MSRTLCPIRRAPWALGLVFLLLATACRRDDGVPSWQADALVPLVRDQLGIRDLVADSLLDIDPDGALRLVYADRLLRVDLIDEGIAIPDTGLTVSVSLETLVLEDRAITTAISLGRILQAVPGGPLLITLINTGAAVTIPAIADVGTGVVPIDATDFFTSADIDSGYLDVAVTNGLAFDLSDALFVLRDPAGGFEVLRDSFDLIPAGATVTASRDLSGLTVGGLLEAELVRVSTPGTGSPVSMDTADAVVVEASVRGLKVLEATAVFPAQDLVDSESDVVYDLGGPEVTRLEIASGNVVIEVVNTIGDSIYVEYDIPGATGPDGGAVSFEAVVPPAPPGGSVFIDERFDLSGYAIDLRGPEGNAVNTFSNRFRARIDSTGRVVSIALTDSIRVNYGLENIVPSALYGYAGKAEFTLDETVDFGFTEGVTASALDLDGVTLGLVLRNGQGVEGEVLLDALTASNSASGASVGLDAPSLIGQPLAVPRALANPFAPGLTTITLDGSNSNVDALIETLPDRLAARGTVRVNPNGNSFGYQDFVIAVNHLDLEAELALPFRLSAEGLTLTDTLPFELFAGSDDPTVVVRAGTLRVSAANGFPLRAHLQLVFLDESGAELSRLFPAAERVPAGALQADCRSTVPAPWALELTLDDTDVDALRAATRVRVEAVLATEGATACGAYVTLYEDQVLDVTLSASLTLDVLADF